MHNHPAENRYGRGKESEDEEEDNGAHAASNLAISILVSLVSINDDAEGIVRDMPFLIMTNVIEAWSRKTQAS